MALRSMHLPVQPQLLEQSSGQHSLEAWRRYMSDARFTELEYYYRPVGLPRERQPWLASVWRRPKKEQIALDIA